MKPQPTPDKYAQKNNLWFTIRSLATIATNVKKRNKMTPVLETSKETLIKN
jgi:hypothetical protein